MEILTLNIRHGGQSRLPKIVDFLARHTANVVVITEFQDNQNARHLQTWFKDRGFQTHDSHPPERANGVLIASNLQFEPLNIGDAFLNEPHRCTSAVVAGVLIVGVYFAQREAKLPLYEFLLGNKSYISRPAVIIGDFNTGKHHVDEAGATFFLSDKFAALEEMGWIDAFRHLNGDVREYSWLHSSKNGFRVDHAFVSPPLTPALRRCEYLHESRSASISDHSAMRVIVGPPPN